MTIENMQFKVNDKLEKRITSLEKELKQSKKTTDVLVLISTQISLLVKLVFNKSTYKGMTPNEIEAIAPTENESLRALNDGIYKWLIII